MKKILVSMLMLAIMLSLAACGSENFKVGDYITFGIYEQDNDTSNGKEDIEWLVLDKKDGKALVISKYALDYTIYNSDYKRNTWETSYLRKWLNDEFLNAAFSTEQQAQIQDTIVSADRNPNSDRDPGNNTTDKVFLLSTAEIEKYFTSSEARRCAQTIYAKKKGGAENNEIWTESGKGACWWWLRSPGSDYNFDGACGAAIVSDDGDIGSKLVIHSSDVRPAMWIDLDS